MSMREMREKLGIPVKRGMRVCHRKLAGTNHPVAWGVIHQEAGGFLFVIHDNAKNGIGYHPEDLIYHDDAGNVLWPPEQVRTEPPTPSLFPQKSLYPRKHHCICPRCEHEFLFDKILIGEPDCPKCQHRAMKVGS